MRFGIVGTNFVSDFFMAAIKEVKNASVSAVSSRSLEKGKAFADKYGIPEVFDSYEKMSDSGKIDAVYLAVPNALHKEMSEYFLNKKIPVLCEKPLASNDKEAKEMFECAKQNDTYLADAIIPLYTPNFQILKNSLPKIGVLRRANLVFSKYSSRYDAYLRGENPTTFRRDLSNGALMDLGIYPLACAIGLFGKPKEVIARGMILPSGVDALGTGLLIYDGFQVNLSYSKVTDTEYLPEIEGEQGNLYTNGISQLPEVWFVDRKTKTKEILSIDQGNPMSHEIQNFVDSVSSGLKQSKVVPWQLSLDILETATKVRKEMGVSFPADEK